MKKSLEKNSFNGWLKMM